MNPEPRVPSNRYGDTAGSGRRRRLAAVLGVAVVIAAGLLSGATPAISEPTSPDQIAPQWSPNDNETIPEGDVQARMIDELILRDEAIRRFDVERAAAALQQEAETRWPSTYGGLWIDQNPFAVSVAFTQNAAANVESLKSQFPYPQDLRAVTAPYPLEVLASLQRLMGEDRLALQEGQQPAHLPVVIRDTRGVYDLDIDVRTTRLIVRVAQASSALRDAFADTYSSAVTVQSGLAEPGSSTCTQTDCRYAMLGGIQLYQGTTTGYCSSAFTAVSGSTRFVLSAGHCYTLSGITSRRHAGSYYGYTNVYSLSGPVDAERIRHDSSAWRESSKFFVQNEDPRMVTSYKSHANIAIGTYIGKTGVRTGTTRGYVESKSVAPSYVPNSYNFVSADFCVNGGDSGGAVFGGNTAWGIVSGRFTNTSCRGTTGGSGAGVAIFGAMNYALSSLSVSLLMNVNLAPNASYSHSCTVLLSCTFDASTSTDEDGSITTYSWTFGDGTTGSGRVITKTYTLPGSYTVKLTVKDNNGATHSTSKTITVV